MPRTEDVNRATIGAYYSYLGSGEGERLLALHKPDLVFAMAGKTVVSGRHHGLGPCIASLSENVLSKLDTSTGSFVKGWRICIADGDYVVGLLHGGQPTRDGRTYDQYYLQMFRLEDGLIAGVSEFFDTVMVETAIFGNALRIPRQPPENGYDLALAKDADRKGNQSASHGLASALGRAFEARDFHAFEALHAPDLVSNIVGSTPISGRFHGRDRYVELNRFREKLSPRHMTFGRPFRIVCADNRAICVLARETDVTPDGRSYDQQYGFVYEIRDGLIAEVFQFFDTAEFENIVCENPFLRPATASALEPYDIMSPI